MFLSKTKKSKYYQIIYFKNGKRTTKTTGEVDSKAAELKLQRFSSLSNNFIQSNSDNKNLHDPLISDQNSFPKTFIAALPNQSSSINFISLKKFEMEYSSFVSGYLSDAYVNRSIKPAFKAFINFAGNIQISEINNKIIEQFIISIYRKKKYAAALYYRVLKAAINKAKSWNYIDQNLYITFKLPKFQKTEPTFLTTDQLKTLLKKVNSNSLKQIYLFAFFTGLRGNELLSLTWNDVKLDSNIIQIGSDDFITKTKNIRYIPISLAVKNILIDLKLKNNITDNDYLFTAARGKKFNLDYVSKKFKAAVRSAKLNDAICFHTLRASFGSYLLQSGVPISSISKMLGHQSIATTEKYYTALTLDNLHDAVKMFDSLDILK